MCIAQVGASHTKHLSKEAFRLIKVLLRLQKKAEVIHCRERVGVTIAHLLAQRAQRLLIQKLGLLYLIRTSRSACTCMASAR